MLNTRSPSTNPDFLKCLEQYEQAVNKKKVVAYVGKLNGRTVIKEVPKWNIILRFILWARQSSERKAFHDQMLSALSNPDIDTPLKFRVFNAITEKPSAVFSKKERSKIKSASAEYFKPLPEDCRVKVYEPTSVLPTAKVREADPRSLPEKVAPLQTALPDVSLSQAQSFLEDYFTRLFTAPADPDLLSTCQTCRRDLFQHFFDTRQSDGFVRVESLAIQASLHKARKAMPREAFKAEMLNLCRAEWVCANTLKIFINNMISNGIEHDLPIHGHPASQVGADDLELIQVVSESPELLALLQEERDPGDIQKKLKTDVQEQLSRMAGFPSLSDELKQLDVASIAELGEYQIPEEQLQLMARGRKALLDFQLSVGRRWHDSALLLPESWPTADDFETYKKLLEIDCLSCPQIYKAQRQWMMQQHDSKELHPHEVIEGAGPTGLLLALTQFEEGMNVTVLEKRSTEYERNQVVRLDPKWMNMLKFYLGERYYELFSSEEGEFGRVGRGIIREDGFGEVATKYLEDALHMEMSEIMSLASGGMNRLARHKLLSVEKPEAEGEKYKVIVENESDKVPLKTSIDNVDVLVAAGGANSPVMLSQLGSKLVTESKTYGVSTWQDSKLKNQALDTFDGFRQQLVVDQAFLDQFSQQLNTSFYKGELDWLEVENNGIKVLDAVRELIKPDSQSMKAFAEAIKGRFLQTRCFDNKGLLYIGMEMPEEIISTLLRGVLDITIGTRKIHGPVQDMFVQAWFNALAITYELDKKVGLNTRSIDQKFTTLLDVSQTHTNEHVKVQKEHDAELIVTAAGDAAVSPHFMRYSGLTGAREHVLHLKELAQTATRQASEEEKAQALEVLKEKAEKTRSYVLRRGEIFLKSRPKPLNRVYRPGLPPVLQ